MLKPIGFVLTMTDILSWHNSEVGQIVDLTAVDGTVRIVLSAACVQRQLPGDEAGAVWGFVKPLEVILRQARLGGPLIDCLGSLSHGELRTGGHGAEARGLGSLPLPWQTSGAVQLALEFRNGSTLTVWAEGASCEAGLDACFIESYAC